MRNIFERPTERQTKRSAIMITTVWWSRLSVMCNITNVHCFGEVSVRFANAYEPGPSASMMAKFIDRNIITNAHTQYAQRRRMGNLFNREHTQHICIMHIMQPTQ